MSPKEIPNGAIVVEDVWKRFRADKTRQLLRDRISEMSPINKKHATTQKDTWRWVLRDIQLQVEPGQAIGLIGANGSGKSTLLKILTQVMYPNRGSLCVQGRVGALLEVRAGLHSDLSGRENVFLYGSLLGLSRRDISARFDDIVSFAQLSDAIDRQIKYYSSGMQLRLGFSIASFLEPDILLVDEALAVGDALFQQRCLERMGSLISQGTTLVLVSHDPPTVRSICTRGIWLADGVIQHDGNIDEAIEKYRIWVDGAYHIWLASQEEKTRGTDSLSIHSCKILQANECSSIQSQRPFTIQATVTAASEFEGTITFGISEGEATPLFVSQHAFINSDIHTDISIEFPYLPLPQGRFYVWCTFVDKNGKTKFNWQPIASFELEGKALESTPPGILRLSPIQIETTWNIERSSFHSILDESK